MNNQKKIDILKEKIIKLEYLTEQDITFTTTMAKVIYDTDNSIEVLEYI